MSKSSVQGKQQQETVAQQQQELFVRRLSMSIWTKAARGNDREAIFTQHRHKERSPQVFVMIHWL